MASFPKRTVSLVRIVGGNRYRRRVSPYALVSSTEAARFLGYGLRHLYRLVEEAKLKIASRRDGKIFFRFVDLYRLKESRSKSRESEKGGKEGMATKDELRDRISSLEEGLEQILSLANEIADKAREALDEEDSEQG